MVEERLRTTGLTHIYHKKIAKVLINGQVNIFL